jgi:hypothetical protein
LRVIVHISGGGLQHQESSLDPQVPSQQITA